MSNSHTPPTTLGPLLIKPLTFRSYSKAQSSSAGVSVESNAPASPTPDAPQSPDEPQLSGSDVLMQDALLVQHNTPVSAFNVSKDSNDPLSPELTIVEND